MLNFLPGPLKGAIAMILFVVHTVFWTSLLFAASILKFIIPIDGWRKFCGPILDGLATNWISTNNLIIWLLTKTKWDITGADNLTAKDWYMVISNHQTWVDIPVLQKTFNRKIPFLKFFLKKELIWVPILGLAWWALDYPFMKRYSKEFLEKNPGLKGKDLETTKKACEKFRTIPVSVMNYVEGTRFTQAKHDKQQSPFKRLLKPKAAGVAFVLGAMGEQMRSILDVTIFYPEGAKNIWDFFCGRVHEIKVDIKSMPVSPEIMGDYFNDEAFRERFQEWLNKMWEEKDKKMEAMSSTR